MSIDIKTFLTERIKDIDSDIDRSPGSVFYDFFINPLSLVLEDYNTEHEEILAAESATDAADLSTDTLDSLGLNFLLERIAGTKSIGYVTFYYNRPITLEIAKGSKIQTEDGLEYEIPIDIYVPKTQMEANTTYYPYYDTGLIPIISAVKGEDYNKPADTRFSLVTTNIVVPVKITNLNPITSGTDQETNSTFYNRLRNSVYNNSLASKAAIDNKVSENFPTVVKTEVVGAKHPLMIRDLTTLAETVASYEEEDFLHTYSGMHDRAYDNKHTAWFGEFQDTDSTAAVAIPSITGWSKEFTNEMYQGLYLQNDLSYAYSEHDVIVREYFGDLYDDNVQVDLGLILASGNWEVHDGINPSQSLFYVDEIRVEGDQLYLGKYLDPDDPNNSSVAVALTTISGLMDLLDSNIDGTSDSAYAQLNELVLPANFNNTAPIFHKQIDQHLGVEIDFTMSTSDNTEYGEMAYATVLRHSEVFLPHDGYGLAWRKQPEFLIRLNKGAGYYTAADVTTFRDQYGFNPVTAGIVGSDYIKNNEEYWKYNVYLVDNDVLQEEVWIGHDQVWDQTSGSNQFLVAGKVWIESDITYKFKMKIYETLGFEGWVHEEDNPPADPYSTANRVLYRGATYPQYVPVSGNKVTRTNGVDVLETAQSHFGIGVSQTRNSEWVVDDLLIRSFVETFPMHLFRFKINQLEASWDLTGPLNVDYYGVGYDPEEYALAGNVGHSSTQLSIYNNTDSAWEIVGTHTATIDDSRALQLIDGEYDDISDYIDDDMFVNLAALPTNTGPSFPDDANHSLVSYFISINNSSTEGIHRGNAADVYVYDPDNLQLGTAVVSMIGNTISMAGTNFPGYIAHITEVREFISKIPFDDSTYSVVNNDKGKSFSNDADYTITFDVDDMTGALVEVEYRFWTRGSLVDDLINASDSKYPTSDIMVKAMPPTIVIFEKLEYSGGLAVSEMREKVKDYFNSLTATTFDKSDVIDLLYDNGANYVNLDMTLKIIRYDTEFAKESITITGQTYVIPQNYVSAFYTNEDYLTGMEQV